MVIAQKHCVLHRYEATNLWYSCVSAAMDHYALEYYGAGNAAWNRWLEEYGDCNEKVDSAGAFEVNGAPCGESS